MDLETDFEEKAIVGYYVITFKVLNENICLDNSGNPIDVNNNGIIVKINFYTFKNK